MSNFSKRILAEMFYVLSFGKTKPEQSVIASITGLLSSNHF